MAKAKIILSDSPSKQLKDGTFPLCLKITHQRKRKHFNLGKHCTSKQWNKESSRFRKNYPNHNQENSVLLTIEKKADDIIRNLERDDISFSFDKFSSIFLDNGNSIIFCDYLKSHIDKLIEADKIGTADTFKSTLNGITRFLQSSEKYKSKKNTLLLVDIDYTFLTDLEQWYRTKENPSSNGGISVRMRDIRTLMNKAINDELIKDDNYPFRKYKISKLKKQTKKRAIDKEDMLRILDLDFPDNSKERFAQDVFIFSFYTRGMNFVDIAKLKPENIIGDRIEYRRSKTKTRVDKIMSIKISTPARKILDYYLDNGIDESDYIFPILNSSFHITATQQKRRRKKVLAKVNKTLKEIASMIGMDDLRLTTYVSRHTYANVLKNKNISTTKISELMGHSDTKVTEIYLKSFDNDVLDATDEHLL